MKKPGVPAAVFNIDGKVLARKSISLSREIRKTESNVHDLLEAYNMRQDGGLSAHPSRASSIFATSIYPQCEDRNKIEHVVVRSCNEVQERTTTRTEGLLASMRRFN